MFHLCAYGVHVWVICQDQFTFFDVIGPHELLSSLSLSYSFCVCFAVIVVLEYIALYFLFHPGIGSTCMYGINNI